MSPSPHLLYVAWGFPPCRSGGVYRALATANACAAAGWRVTVLTATRESFQRFTGVDESLESAIDERVQVVRVPFEWPAQDPDISNYSWLRANWPPLWRQLRAHLDRLSFPETGYGPWRATLEDHAMRIHDERPVDLTIATANPHVDFTAALQLNRRHDVPFVMDYRDAWSLDLFTEQRVHRATSRVGRWERKLITAASEVWFVNEALAQWHRSAYPDAADRIRVVPNGWDFDVRPDKPLPRPEAAEAPRFGYLGTLTPAVPLRAALEGWHLAKQRGLVPRAATLDFAGHLGYFATPDDELSRLIDDHEVDGVRYLGPVAKSAVSSFYHQVDALVLLAGGGRYVTSGKVYEYIAACRPIVSVSGPEFGGAEVLSSSPLWCPSAGLTAQDVADAFAAATRLAAGTDAFSYRSAAHLAVKFSRNAALAAPVSSLRDLIGRP